MRAPFEELRVWQAAQHMAEEVYRVTVGFPVVERFGLTAQLRRAAVSVPANVAEGNARRFRSEYAQACCVARGSVAEIKSLLNLSFRLRLLEPDTYGQLLHGYEDIGRMLQRLIERLQPEVRDRVQAGKEE